jgi:hypothetical protein
MRLMFVGDGPRDSVTLPVLVGKILKHTLDPDFREWKQIRLTRGTGYQRKLQFALIQARDGECEGAVAVVDQDSAHRRERLLKLKEARRADRNSATYHLLPTAVGEASPHLEAWLLDDPKAVRDVLKIDSSTKIPVVTKSDPKASLNCLIDECPRKGDRLQLLAEIATSIRVDRCTHARDTGFEEFVEEVEVELRPLAEQKRAGNAN